MHVPLRKKGNTKVTIHPDGDLEVKFYSTLIVDVGRKVITLDTGGHRTVCTKRRMNQASKEYSLGFTVCQEDFQWYVSFKGQVIPFNDSVLTLER